jgi:hypothetical protein
LFRQLNHYPCFAIPQAARDGNTVAFCGEFRPSGFAGDLFRQPASEPITLIYKSRLRLFLSIGLAYQSAWQLLYDGNCSVVVAVIAVHVVQMSINQVINVIAMGNRLMATVLAMFMV